MAENKDIKDLLNTIQAGIKTHSVKELNEAIIKHLDKTKDKHEDVQLVLDTVSRNFKISKRTLIHSRANNTNIKLAQQISYCILHLHMGLPMRYIATRVFYNWHNTVFKAVKHYKELDMAIKHHKEFKEIYDRIQGEVYASEKNRKTK